MLSWCNDVVCFQKYVKVSKKVQNLKSRMHGIAWEIIRFLFFIYLVLLLAYSRVDSDVFYTKKYVQSFGINDDDANISRQTEIYDFVQGLIDGDVYHYDRDTEGFFGDGRAIYLQEPRLRQFRTHDAHCTTPKLAKLSVRCIEKFTTDYNEDVGRYREGWSPYHETLNMTEWTYNFNSDEYPTYES